MHYKAEPLTQEQRLRIQAYQAAEQAEQEEWDRMQEEEGMEQDEDQDGKATDDFWDVSPLSGGALSP